MSDVNQVCTSHSLQPTRTNHSSFQTPNKQITTIRFLFFQ